MEIFVARQPIFDRSLNVLGYELLFRTGPENQYPGGDPDEATHRTMLAWFFSIGAGRPTAGKQGFVNFIRNLLVDGTAEILDPRNTVIEILEDVQGDHDIVEACLALRELGFRLALDDVDADPDEILVDLGGIPRVDLTMTTTKERARIVERYGSSHHLLADKVETPKQCQETSRAGFDSFQGYFFASPEIVTGRRVPIQKLHCLQLVREINRPEFRCSDLADIVMHDASLSYRLLRFINSAAFGWRVKVGSIQHALVLLGEREIRRWVTLPALGCVAEDRPAEVLTSSVTRARFCESMADRIGPGHRSTDMFLLGLLSRFDVVAGQSMEEVLEPIHLADDIQATLIDPETPGPLRDLLGMLFS